MGAFFLKNWQAIAVVILVALASAYLYRRGVEAERARVTAEIAQQYKDKIAQYEERDKKAAEEKAAFEKREEDYLARLSDMAAKNVELLKIVNSLELVTHGKPDPVTGVVQSSLTDAFKLCYNAAVRRDPETIAACKAAGVSGSVSASDRLVHPPR